VACAKAQLLAGLAVLLGASSAGAWCRTTTCDVDDSKGVCTRDADNCATSGKPLFWPGECAWFGVQKDGSPKRHITYETLHSAVTNAFGKWSKANCNPGNPSFSMTDTDLLYGPVECTNHEFHTDACNASAWMFRDTDWPYVGSTTTIALTTLSVEISSGRIFDADVEINSWGTNITTSDVNVGADLESVVTHEAGHFLGLAHSAVTTATMYFTYNPSSIAIRTLSPDDQAGMCAAYPPGPAPTCGEPEPLFGFSTSCGGKTCATQPVDSSTKKGCAVALGMRAHDTEGAGLFLALAAGLRLLRRRR